MAKAARGIYGFFRERIAFSMRPHGNKGSRHKGSRHKGVPSDPTAAFCLTAMLLRSVYC